MATGAVGYRCAVCGAVVGIDHPTPWRCPNSTDDDRHHALLLTGEPQKPMPEQLGSNPFVTFREYLAWDAFAEGCGVPEHERAAIVDDLCAAVESTAGTAFSTTPFLRADELSDVLGFSGEGGIWIKDETGNVGGSHKARFLVSPMLYLLTAERLGVTDPRRRPALAIASCGNAAIAASTLARAVDWPIQVFVPEWASGAVVEILQGLGAEIQRCPRRAHEPFGDPCVHRFREAVNAGAIPFSTQGTENATCLDSGRTIGWEMALQYEAECGRPLDRLFVQVGGGAFVNGVAKGFFAGGTTPQVMCVQMEGCAPLALAWDRAESFGRANAALHWSECMAPWPQPPESLADGILDDETYDWLGAFDAMLAGGGRPVVARERLAAEAFDLAHRHTSIDVSPTGAAGLAGVLATRAELGEDERLAVVFSGVRRG